MTVSANSQAYIFFCTVAGGMMIALVYDVFRILRKAVKTGSLVTYLQDLLYWLIVAVIMFLTIYYSNDGEIRAYLFIGAFIGVILYSLLFSRIVMGSSLFIIKIVTYVIKGIILIISYPVRLILRAFSVPARKLAGITKKAFKKAKSSGKVKFFKFHFYSRKFKKLRKKI